MPRPKGSLNRRGQQALRELKALLGDDFNPLLLMAEMAYDSELEKPLRLNAAKEVTKYCYPQIKASEITHDLSDDVDEDKVARITQRLLSGRKAEDSE